MGEVLSSRLCDGRKYGCFSVKGKWIVFCLPGGRSKGCQADDRSVDGVQQGDYVYESEKLATLSGKKLHGKRNHINKFKQVNEDWSYEKITKENIEECFQMALQWRIENGCEADEEKNAEMCVTLNSLRLYEELELTGGLLRVNGKVVAFTLGEEVSDDTFVVHIEKAFAEIQGAYPMINQQFVEHECMKYKYINREEDTGAEGLRKAKLSYRPVFLVEKGTVTKREATV